MHNKSGSRIDTIFVLAVFGVFAAAVLMTLLLAANIYKNTSDKSQEGYAERTCLSYIWSKVKNANAYGTIYVNDFHGTDVLCIEEIYGESPYQTIIYLYDGWVCELFYEAGLEFYPEDGTPVIEAESLSFTVQENDLLEVTANGRSLYLFLG